jgi:hypothetical protein
MEPDAPLREKPYVALTWLPPFLIGDRRCWGGLRHMATRKYSKRPSDFDEVAWKLAHTPLVEVAADEARAAGREVWIEREFRVTQNGATIAGRADLVSLASSEAEIIDCKSGVHRRASHMVQVMTEMVLMPLAVTGLAGRHLTGSVLYREGAVQIPVGAVDGTFVDRLWYVVLRAVGDGPAEFAPSVAECKFCPIATCPFRVDLGNQEGKGESGM